MPRLPKGRGPQEPPAGPQPDYHPTVVDTFTDADGEEMVELADGNIEPAREWLPEDLSQVDTGSVTVPEAPAEEYVPPRPELPRIDRKKKPVRNLSGKDALPYYSGFCEQESRTEGEAAGLLHGRCKGGFINGGGVVTLCACPHHNGETRCLICGTVVGQDEFDADFRVCLDAEACADVLHQKAIASAHTPVARMIREVKAQARGLDPDAPAKPKREKTDPAQRRQGRPCECGCGLLTGGGKFRPGHDAKLKAALRGGTRTSHTYGELLARGWDKGDLDNRQKDLGQAEIDQAGGPEEYIATRVAQRYLDAETKETH